MHGCGSGTALLVSAEVDSMGGVVDGGIGIGVRTSPRRAAIEKAQAQLRQEYDVREERRREIEFLEKGGNPLDFKFGNSESVSVQSTSLTDQQAEQFVTSEAKGSFAPTASPHGDSVESSGRPGVPTVFEPNSADNLLLFDGENELLEGERNSIHRIKRKNIVPSEQSSQMDGTQNAKESEDSAIFRPYARRNRSKIKRDAARSSSNNIVQTHVGDGSSLTVRGSSRDAKGSISDSNNQKERNMLSVTDPKTATSNGDVGSKVVTSDNHTNMDLDRVQIPAETIRLKVSLPDDKLDVTAPKRLTDDQHNQSAQVDSQRTFAQVDAQETPVDVASGKPDLVGVNELIVSAGVDCLPCEATEKTANENCSNKQNGFGDQDRGRKSNPTEGQIRTAAIGTKLDLESSSQNSLSIDVNNDSDAFNNPKFFDSNGVPTEQTSDLEGTMHLGGGEMVKEENEIKVDSGTAMNGEHNSASQNHSTNNSMVKDEEEINTSKSEQHEAKCTSNIEGLRQNVQTISEIDKNLSNVLGCYSKFNKENLCSRISQGTVDISICEPPESVVLGRSSADAPDHQTESCNHLKLADKAHEDSILEEARIIEAKRKRIAELSVGTLPFEARRKSHWDFVLEEMAWLANDFAQERLWKMTAAAQICHRAAFTFQLRSEQQNQCYKLKKVALNLAKAVMQFWHSAEVLLNNDDPNVGPETSRRDLVGSTNNVAIEASNKETSKNLEQQRPSRNVALAIHGYAVRFLKHNSSPVLPLQAEAPATLDRISDSGIMEVSWDDHFTEESLFHAVSSGAMETYRKSIESHLEPCEKTASSMQEEVDTSMHDAVAEFSYHDTAYDEDECETSAYYLPGAFEGSKSSKFAHKKRKKLIKYTGRSYEVGADIPYGHGTVGSQQSMMRRPANNLNVGSIPTKRMRTASRQRIVGPFSAGATGNLQAPTKTDASSGDTSSLQDDQSTLHGGSQIQKSMEVESAGDFEKLPYDCVETSAKPKKKKKAKHPGWQLNSTGYSEQRDHSKKRCEDHHFDSNGNNGLFWQHNAKKPKIMKQSLETTFDNITPMTGSVPSPAASQMSNMTNPTKFIKLIGVRDKGRKAKALKMSAGQPGSGSPWSLFEDQALVVLVHDMGPNWELVSDAMNSTLQFKCIFRKPQECKEHHKVLMDRGAGDGADSAEDSGSSQSYPSTLPGIPKGSARQLFQRLQGPMEEDTVKSHFEKIIMIGKKYHYRKSQNDNHDPRQIVPVHDSHVIALSQVCPNNLNGGILTPLDLCDLTASSPDAPSLGFQGSHASGLGMSNQGAMLHTSGANSPLQGSSGIVLGSNMSSPSGPLNHPVRDGRYNVPRANLPVDEQQRTQQFNQMVSGRNIQQTNLPAPGSLSGAEHGVRMLPGGNGMGIMCGMNRSMPMLRPGFQGMASSPMMNSGSMLSSSMVGMSPVSMHSGAGPGQGNLMLRPREAMHMMRPGYNPDHQKRPLMVSELQMQVTQGNGQGIHAFNRLSSAFSNQTTLPPGQTYPLHSQQPHQMSLQQSHGLSNHHPHLQGQSHATGSQQQANAMRLAKERQIKQQRYMQQQQQQQHQQQIAASGTLMPHVQPQSQPISSSLQNNSQIQPQISSQPVSVPPITSSSMTPIALQHQHKHHLTSHGLSHSSQSGASGLNNQVGKQRQRPPQQQQQFQQSGRNHPQQQQHAQSQQQAKLLKGIGRGNTVLHQNLNVDHLNALDVAPGNQSEENGEQMMHLMQGQSLYSGSTLSTVQPSKPVPCGHSPSATHQAVLPATMTSNHQHLQLQPQLHHKQVNHTQTQPIAKRMLQQNRQLNADLPNKSQTDQPQADQPVSNASLMDNSSTAALPQVFIDSGNIGPVSSAVAPQWKASEPLYDSGIPNIANQVGSFGSPPLTNSGGGDAVTSVNQGLGQRQLSGSLPPHGHNVGSPWQQQSQLQQSPTPPASQQHCQPQGPQVLQQNQQQLPLQQQSHQQTQHLQVAQGSLYIRPTNSKLE